MSKDRDDLRLARRLAMDATDWERRQKESSALLRGARLFEAEEWLENHPEATSLLQMFVGASREHEKDEQVRKLDQERQLREAAEARVKAEREGRVEAERRAGAEATVTRIAEGARYMQVGTEFGCADRLDAVEFIAS